MQMLDDDILSLASLQVPFLNRNDCARVQMNCNQLRQSICLTNPEVPLVKTGYEGTYTPYSSMIRIARDDGMCVYKDDEIMVVHYTHGGGEVIPIRWNSVLSFDRTLYTELSVGDKFTKGQTLAHTLNIHPDTHELMLGKNMFVGFASAGWNYEDAIIVSESCASKMAYRCVEHGRLEINEEELFSIDSEMYMPMPANGTFVRKGDILFKINTRDVDSIASFVPLTKNITAPCDGYFYSKILIRRENVANRDMARWLRSVLAKQSMVENYRRSAFAKCDDPEEATVRYCWSDNKKNISVKTMVVDYWIVNDKKLLVGSKLSNRHGNKGVVSIILPDDKMPYITNEDGSKRPLDIVFNSMGVLSRMNLGQLFEIHLNWASENYLKKISSLPDEQFLEKCIEFIRLVDNTPDHAYSRAADEHCKKHPEVAKNIRENGLQIIAPAFHSCTMEQLLHALEVAGVSCKAKMFNTITNEEVETSVGHMYVMRLQHEPDHKIFARSVGLYGKHEQPAAGANAHRFGEMEVWALFAYDCPKLITEFLSLKADNPEERFRSISALIDGYEDLYVPASYQTVTFETFKTFLKGCGLRVVF